MSRLGRVAEGAVSEKIETTLNELMKCCEQSNLTISEMQNIAIMFPRYIRKKINNFEDRTVFTSDPD